MKNMRRQAFLALMASLALVPGTANAVTNG